MTKIERHSDATLFNRVLNDPSVRPWVADAVEGVLDVSAQVANPHNVLLVGKHGGCLFFKLMDGIYEVHSAVLPAGRGEWVAEFTRAAGAWLYCHTDCVEILTRVPHGHVGAKAASVKAGMKYQWTRNDMCRFRGVDVPVDIYSTTIFEWPLGNAELEKVGKEFHDRMQAIVVASGHPSTPHENDPDHNRIVGACIEIAKSGQHRKACALYNRWAIASRHAPVSVVSDEPPTVKFDAGLLIVRNGEIKVAPCSMN